MINNKKGWVAKDFVVATLIFSAIIALLVIMVGSLANDYENTDVIDSQFSEKFDKFSENSDIAGNMYEAINSEEGLSLLGTFEIILQGTLSIINLIFTSVGTATAQIFGFGDYFGIPSEITGIVMFLAVGILTTSLVFIIINSINAKQNL